MTAVKRLVWTAVFFVLSAGAAFVFLNYYPYLFSRRVKGVLVSIERVQLNVSLMQGGAEAAVNPSLFSFAVAIREDNGEIAVASAEDRQWAAAQKGYCVEAVYYPYPPWKVMKSGTYHNARLDSMSECPDKAAKALEGLPNGTLGL